MKKHRFFIKEKIGNNDKITITDQTMIHQMKDVLRLRSGDHVILLDENDFGKELHGTINTLSKKEAVILKESFDFAQDKENSQFPKNKITLCSSMIKKDKYEWVLQKGTEIGITEFMPVISQRTEKVNLNIERAEKIIREAAEQSERSDLPKLSSPEDLEDVLQFLQSRETQIIVLNMGAEKLDVSQFGRSSAPELNSFQIAVFIGPEGGWSEKDIDTFKIHDVKFVSLGKNVLRAETASIAITALLLLP